jgi:hypothetical protein
MHAEMFQPVMKAVPSIRTVPVDDKQGFASYGQQSLGPHGSEASDATDLLQPTGLPLTALYLR